MSDDRALKQQLVFSIHLNLTKRGMNSYIYIYILFRFKYTTLFYKFFFVFRFTFKRKLINNYFLLTNIFNQTIEFKNTHIIYYNKIFIYVLYW